MKVALTTALFAGIASLAAPAARAAMITETYTFAPLAGYSFETGTSFAQFNPALGTLNSVTFNDTATATFSGGGISESNAVVYTEFLNFNLLDMIASSVGNSSAPAFVSFTKTTAQADLDYLIGSGLVSTSVAVSDGSVIVSPASVGVSNDSDTPANVSSTFGTESVTYNYTPAAAVPEPGTIALLGGGLMGLMGLLLRRSRTSIAA